MAFRQSDLLRRMFETVLQRCMREGLVAGEAFAVDASKLQLCSMGQFDPDDWELPPKPRWMRWKTYKRYEERFDTYEDVLNESL